MHNRSLASVRPNDADTSHSGNSDQVHQARSGFTVPNDTAKRTQFGPLARWKCGYKYSFIPKPDRRHFWGHAASAPVPSKTAQLLLSSRKENVHALFQLFINNESRFLPLTQQRRPKPHLFRPRGTLRCEQLVQSSEGGTSLNTGD